MSAKRAPLQDQQNLKLQEEICQLRNRVKNLEAELTKSHQLHEQDAVCFCPHFSFLTFLAENCRAPGTTECGGF
jgi:hypothetical protein